MTIGVLDLKLKIGAAIDDPVNMLLVMAPLFLLYELGIFLSRLTYRPRP